MSSLKKSSYELHVEANADVPGGAQVSQKSGADLDPDHQMYCKYAAARLQKMPELPLKMRKYLEAAAVGRVLPPPADLWLILIPSESAASGMLSSLSPPTTISAATLRLQSI